MHNLSAAGDGALLVPASVMLVAYLLAMRRSDVAGIFAVALVTCGAATVAVKLLFRACGTSITDLDVSSPSGHASFATLFYGALAILAATNRPLWARAAIAVATFLLVMGIAVSRVATWTHSAEEVAFGLAIGMASLALFSALHTRIGRPAVPAWHLAAAPMVALALTLLIGRHLPSEHWIQEAALRASAALDVCQGVPERAAALRLRRARP